MQNSGSQAVITETLPMSKEELLVCVTNAMRNTTHQSASKTLNVLSGHEVEEQEEEEEEVFEEAIAEEEEEIEQARISMCNENDRKKVRTMRFKGEIAQVPICALLDSGSTHSFINSNVIERLPVKITKTTPMVVLVALFGSTH